jgi:hypothetical protein
MSAHLSFVFWNVQCYKKRDTITPDSQFSTGAVGFSMFKINCVLGELPRITYEADKTELIHNAHNKYGNSCAMKARQGWQSVERTSCLAE